MRMKPEPPKTKSTVKTSSSYSSGVNWSTIISIFMGILLLTMLPILVSILSTSASLLFSALDSDSDSLITSVEEAEPSLALPDSFWYDVQEDMDCGDVLAYCSLTVSDSLPLTVRDDVPVTVKLEGEKPVDLVLPGVFIEADSEGVVSVNVLLKDSKRMSLSEFMEAGEVASE